MTISAKGRFGAFGGRFVPETLVPALDELDRFWNDFQVDVTAQQELKTLLAQYAGRPTPLSRARNLPGCDRLIVLMKREDLLHTGAHKLNNALGQVLLARRMGKRRIVAETGAGQHGVATATACALLGLPCGVYMGALDVERHAGHDQRARPRRRGAQPAPGRRAGRGLGERAAVARPTGRRD